MTIRPLRLIVFGGAGVFGSRFCRMAKRDGHKVWVVGRSDISDLAAKQMNCEFLRLDRSADLAALWALSPDAVVDAAGPFQTYGADLYRLPQMCIANGVHYFDLCDDTDFCVGIAALNDAAKSAGVVVSSGVSSVPALSSAVVAELIVGLSPVELNIAILPGNQTPRGSSVTQSIMVQTGTEFQRAQGGRWLPTRNWSGRRVFELPKGHNRIGRRFNLPDVALFPDNFGIPSVTLWAGLELRVLSIGLWFFGVLRHRLHLPYRPWMAAASIWFSNRLLKRGTDVGGMVVTLRGHTGQAWVDRTWRVLVEDGEGPFVPSTALRAALRQLDSLTAGAGPALNLVDLDSCEAAMSDLASCFDRSETEVVPAFPALLGLAFDNLPDVVQGSHQTVGLHHFEGRGSVTRGTAVVSRLIAWVFGFPAENPDIAVSVTKTAKGGSEVWDRQFGTQTFRPHLTNNRDSMSERFGPFTFDLDLHVKDERLYFPVKRGRFLGIPLPRFLLPKSIAHERMEDGKFRFDVQLRAPLTGQMIVHYQGWLEKQS